MSVQLAPTSAATMLTVWTLWDPTSAAASRASEAMALNALVRPRTASQNYELIRFRDALYVIKPAK